MSKVILLDCTLRDGGYVNQWHFGRKVITEICAKLSEAKIDIIELGFLTASPHTEDDSLYSDYTEINRVTKKCDRYTSKTAAMIAIGEMEMNPVSLPAAENCQLDIVRITFHNTEVEIEKAFNYAQCLMNKGYLVCIQPVGTTSYTDEELIKLIAKINLLKPYAFYLVDTLGILHQSELLHFISLIDKHLFTEIKLGFHSHNNMQMSYSNAQCIIGYRSEREFILDCSIYGMGRGAGNLCTELITQYENRMADVNHYEMMPLYEILDNYIYPIFTKSSWGYNAHYYIAAIHQCHPNYAAFLMNKQTLTMNEVELILKNIPSKDKYIYHKQLIESMYYNFQNHSIDDRGTLTMLAEKINGRDVLLLAPGKSLKRFQNQIIQFIANNAPIVISINSQFSDFESDYIFVGNLKRLYMLDTERLNKPIILTSNLPNIISGGIYVNYATLCTQGNDESDNSGIMLIRLMEKIGMRRVYIAGYDGFNREIYDNFFDERMINSINPDEAEKKTLLIAEQFNEIIQHMEIISLTPSRYFD